MSEHTHPLLVHGVVAASAIDSLREVQDVFGLGAIQVHVAGDLALLASPVPATIDLASAFADQARVAQIALAHHEILAEICSSVDVVPVRLGGAISGARAALALVRDHGARFRSALHRVAGTVEFAVVIGDSDAKPATVLAVSDGRSYLRARAVVLSEVYSRPQRVAATIAAVAATLDRAARGRVERALPNPEPDAPARHFDATYLVERAGVPAFRGLCETTLAPLADDHLLFRVRGPWPAYGLTGELGSLQ